MTRERAKELAPIISAYGEGKRVQYGLPGQDVWFHIEQPGWRDEYSYRIAPEPRRRPMTRDEVLNFLAEHPNVLVYIDSGSWFLPGFYNFDTPERYSYCLVENGVRSEPRKFEIEEDGE